MILLTLMLLIMTASSAFTAGHVVNYTQNKEDEAALYPGNSNVFVVYEDVALLEKDGITIGICRHRIIFSNDNCRTFQQLADEHGMRLVLPAYSKQYGRLVLYGYKPLTD